MGAGERVELVNANTRKRNLLMGAAVTLIGLSFLFAPGEEGMLWLMWRDAPWLAAALLAVAVVLLIVWRRTPRN